MEHILVIDDDPDILDAIQFVLEDSGYHVTTSLKGETAKQLTHRNTLPDLLVLDVLLSGMDGRDICRTLKKCVHTKKLPVVMLSAHPHAHQTAMKSGADAFLPKPFDVGILLKTIKHFL